MAKKRKKNTHDVIDAQEDAQGGLAQLVLQLRENALKVGLAVSFIILCVIVGAVVRMNANAGKISDNTEYASAIMEEETETSLEALNAAAENNTTWNAEVTYMAAETALRDQDYTKAEAHFKKVVENFADSEYAPRAADGLAFILENRGENEAALVAYTEIKDKWGDSFTGRCQFLNIGRVQEALGNFEAAREAYETQINRLPDTNTERKARMALDALEQDHPELFPEEVIAEVVEETTPAEESVETTQ